MSPDGGIQRHLRDIHQAVPDLINGVTLYRVIRLFDLMCVCARAARQKGGVE
jgi:hypothetical protein